MDDAGKHNDRGLPFDRGLALIGDCHGAALVARAGSIDWCCFHRFDARPVFALILDRENGGHFRIAPADSYEVQRRFWLVDNLLLLGRREEARALFERLCGYANDVGLLSERSNPIPGSCWGTSRRRSATLA